MTNKEYREHEGISRSQLFTIINQTPLHFKYQLDHPKEDTASLAFGRAAHKMMLEPEDFFNEFAVAPNVDKRTKTGKEEWNTFCEENAGKEVISQLDYETICDMKKAIDADPNASKFLKGIHEQSYFWTDSATGEVCKVRPDCLTNIDGQNYIVDYKTTDSCADGHFERSVRKYGYKFQSGMYREGMFNNTFEDYGFVFVAQEKTPPYAVRVYMCTEAFINEGEEEFRTAINLYHYCKENNNFFGYEGFDGSISTLVEEG